MSGIQEILTGPTRRWRNDALRNLPFMGQRAGGTRPLQNRPVLCKIRNSINRTLSTRKRFFGDVVGFDATKDIAIEGLLSPIYRTREVVTGLREIVIDRPY